MARSYDIAILSQKVEQMEGQIKANDVVANPSGAASTLLKKIGIDGTNYNVPHTAANIDYESGSVKTFLDGIKPRTVLSIEANEYTSYALALADVKTAFDELTDDEKRRSKLIIGNFILNFVKPNDSSFSALTVATDTIAMRSAYLNSGGNQFYIEAGISAQSVTFSNQSANAQAQAITLIC